MTYKICHSDVTLRSGIIQVLGLLRSIRLGSSGIPLGKSVLSYYRFRFCTLLMLLFKVSQSSEAPYLPRTASSCLACLVEAVPQTFAKRVLNGLLNQMAVKCHRNHIVYKGVTI